MRGRRSNWRWVVVIGLSVLVWRWCRSSDPQVEAEWHVKLAPDADDAWVAKLHGVKVLDAEPLFVRSAALLAADRSAATARSGRAMPDLSSWQRVRVRGTRSAVRRTLSGLQRSPDVITAFEAPKAELPVVRAAG